MDIAINRFVHLCSTEKVNSLIRLLSCGKYTSTPFHRLGLWPAYNALLKNVFRVIYRPRQLISVHRQEHAKNMVLYTSTPRNTTTFNIKASSSVQSTHIAPRAFWGHDEIVHKSKTPKKVAYFDCHCIHRIRVRRRCLTTLSPTVPS